MSLSQTIKEESWKETLVSFHIRGVVYSAREAHNLTGWAQLPAPQQSQSKREVQTQDVSLVTRLIFWAMDQKTIMLIADYGTGDPAFAEVVLQLRAKLPQAFIYKQTVQAFSTLHTGFWLYQLGFAKGLNNTYLFANTAPRLEHKEAQKNNSGEKLMYAKLTNGVEIMAVNAGFAFSFLKNAIAEFAYVNIPNEGSQFRSRDFYPEAVAKMALGDTSFKGEKADPSLIPDFPSSVICSIDGYGNIKTTIRQADITFTPGDHVEVMINGHTHEAIYTDGVFNIENGKLSFAPGSSGHENRFMEVFVRGGHAAEIFGNPKVEDTVVVTKKA